jgi:hypothetical protein
MKLAGYLLDGGMQLVPGDVFVLMISTWYARMIKCGEIIRQHVARCGKMCTVNASLEIKMRKCD